MNDCIPSARFHANTVRVTCHGGIARLLPAVLIFLAASNLRAETIHGRVTRCGGTAGAAGHVVQAFEELQIGFPDERRRCRNQKRPARLVGTTTTGADGTYSIRYQASKRDPEACIFEPLVFVKVFLEDGVTLIHTSDKRAGDLLAQVESFDTGVTRNCPESLVPASLALDPPSIVAGGPPTVGRIDLSRTGGTQSGVTTVKLFASDAGGLVMADAVEVPAGETTVEFTIGSEPQPGKVVTIFASANGTTVMADLAIHPNGLRKGFINRDKRRDLSDSIFLLSFLFLGGEPPPFVAYADVNGSGKVDVSDAVALLGFLFAEADAPSLCTRDPAALPGQLRLDQHLVTDGEQVCIYGNLPDADYRISLKGFIYPNGRRISGNQVLGERELVHCTCVYAVRSVSHGADGEEFYRLCFEVPLDAPSGEYEVSLLPPGGSCFGGNSAGSGCTEDDCAVGPLKLLVQPSHIVSVLEDVAINNDSEPSGDNPAELFFTFASHTGEPDSNDGFRVQFADSFPGGRAGSQHLTSVDQTSFQPDVPVFVSREGDMELTECEEDCASDPDPERCRRVCAEASRRMNDLVEVTLGGAEFDCLDDCSSIWDEVANLGTAALGCLVGVKLGNPSAGCTVGSTLGGILESQLESALEDEDDALGTAELNFNRGVSPFWDAGARSSAVGLSRADIDIDVRNHRLPGFRIVDAGLNLKSVTLHEGGDEPCESPDELFFETRASLGLNGRLGESTRFPSTSGLEVVEGDTADLSAFTLSAGGGAESALFYVEIGVWDYDGEDEGELIGLHSRTHRLGDLLEGFGGTAEELVVNGRELRRVRASFTTRVSGWNSEESCECATSLCAWDTRAPRGRATITYELDVTWEKYPR